MSKLELMLELWRDRFFPLIEGYEPIEYYLDCDAKSESFIQDIMYFHDIKEFFHNTDNFYKDGYTKIVITDLTATYNYWNMLMYKVVYFCEID